MASVFIKRDRLYARIKKPNGKWIGRRTEFRPGQESLALEHAKTLQRDENISVGASPRRGLEREPDDLYLILSSCGSVKIGRAFDCDHRLRQLLAGTPPSVMLTLLGVAPGLGSYEPVLHELYREHRVRGEWFSGVLGERLRELLKQKSFTEVVIEAAATSEARRKMG